MWVLHRIELGLFGVLVGFVGCVMVLVYYGWFDGLELVCGWFCWFWFYRGGFLGVVGTFAVGWLVYGDLGIWRCGGLTVS